LRDRLERLGERHQPGRWGLSGSLLRVAVACCLVPIVVTALTRGRDVARPISELMEPTDSLRRACHLLARDLPQDLGTLRLYARPPVTFYLGGVAPVAPQPTRRTLLATSDPRSWAILDAAMMVQELSRQGGPQLGLVWDAMLRQGGDVPEEPSGAGARWEVAREVPTTLNWPTLLDIDRSAATAASPSRLAPLFLFRPKRPGAAR
jgi:hypothetical protein